MSHLFHGIEKKMFLNIVVIFVVTATGYDENTFKVQYCQLATMLGINVYILHIIFCYVP